MSCPKDFGGHLHDASQLGHHRLWQLLLRAGSGPVEACIVWTLGQILLKVQVHNVSAPDCCVSNLNMIRSSPIAKDKLVKRLPYPHTLKDTKQMIIGLRDKHIYFSACA